MAGEEDPGAAFEPPPAAAPTPVTATPAAAAFTAGLAAALLLAGSLSACGRDESPAQAAPAAPAAAGLRAPSDGAVKDAAITTGVQARLAADSELRGVDIHVDTRAGRVRLRGATPDTAVRRHAGEVARSVAGVAAVDNDLSVQVLQR